MTADCSVVISTLQLVSKGVFTPYRHRAEEKLTSPPPPGALALDLCLAVLMGYLLVMATTAAAEVVHRYTAELDARDFSAARALLADDLRFDGPIDQFDRADDFIKTISGLYAMVSGVEHQAVLTEGDNVAWFYVLHTPVANAPVAEWHTVRNDKIVQIRAYFDARPFAQH
jgi:hypothetical protein